MNFAAATGRRLGRATPCLRDTPQRKLMGTTGRRSTYRRRNAVQANPATSVGGSTATTASTRFTMRIALMFNRCHRGYGSGG